MGDRWKFGNYEFRINPEKYAEQITLLGDNAVTLDGTIITQPTILQEAFDISSVFYQARPRILSELSVGGSGITGIEFMNNQYYILDDISDVVRVYSKNFSTLIKTISLTSSRNYSSFTVASDETIWAIEKTATWSILHKVVGGSRTTSILSSVVGDVLGIKYHNSLLWVVSSSGLLYKLNTSSNSAIGYVDLPRNNLSYISYQGMSAKDGCVIVSYNSAESNGAYFVDTDSGNTCNHFRLPNIQDVSDVTYDGEKYTFLMKNSGAIKQTQGNTVGLDLYLLEKEIKSKGMLSMIDDMGVVVSVAVKEYSTSRSVGGIEKYDVNISAVKIDRSV